MSLTSIVFFLPTLGLVVAAGFLAQRTAGTDPTPSHAARSSQAAIWRAVADGLRGEADFVGMRAALERALEIGPLDDDRGRFGYVCSCADAAEAEFLVSDGGSADVQVLLVDGYQMLEEVDDPVEHVLGLLRLEAARVRTQALGPDLPTATGLAD